MIADRINYWKPYELDHLRQLRAEGHSIVEIATIMGRSFRSVDWQIRKYQIFRPVKTTWSDDRLDTLRKRHAAGDTFSEIADQVGLSRNACIGKAKRLHLPGREPHKAPISATRERRTRFQLRPPPLPLAPERRAPVLNAPEPRNLTILDLEPGDCKWPVTENPPYLFCGNPAVRWEPAYCGFHYQLAHNRNDRLRAV